MICVNLIKAKNFRYNNSAKSDQWRIKDIIYIYINITYSYDTTPIKKESIRWRVVPCSRKQSCYSGPCLGNPDNIKACDVRKATQIASSGGGTEYPAK